MIQDRRGAWFPKEPIPTLGDNKVTSGTHRTTFNGWVVASADPTLPPIITFLFGEFHKFPLFCQVFHSLTISYQQQDHSAKWCRQKIKFGDPFFFTFMVLTNLGLALLAVRHRASWNCIFANMSQIFKYQIVIIMLLKQWSQLDRKQIDNPSKWKQIPGSLPGLFWPHGGEWPCTQIAQWAIEHQLSFLFIWGELGRLTMAETKANTV